MICFTKEAKSIRGISDIIGCINGKFFCLEVKRDISEARKTTGRIALQRKFISDVCKNNGYGKFIYPQNEDEVIKELYEWSS